MEEHHSEVIAMFQKLTHNSSYLSQEKSAEETLVRRESTRTGTRYATPAKGNHESSQNRQFKTQSTNSSGGKFPLSKNPKVDIPIFKGE